MIATGGLLRTNRRQDSQQTKNHAENQRKRKPAERKKNNVVVVKGKLNLCSPSGLVAAVGVVVLMVGIAMAVLGYWPHEGHSQTRAELTNQTVGELTKQTVGELTNQTVGELTNQTSVELTNQMSVVINGSVPQPVSVNGSVPQPVSVNGNIPVSVSTPPRPPSGGFLSEFLDNYLHSDNLKVFGPLVMGIGIFLFICANAVLHENRDLKTKVINLIDIYSMVIDLHSTRTKDHSPINGLVNYEQSRGSMDVNSFNPGGMLELGSGEQQSGRPSMAGRQRGWSRDNQTFTESVYSIYRDQKRRYSKPTCLLCSEQAPYPRQWDSEQTSYPRQWDSEQASYPRQWDSEQAPYPRQWEGTASIVSSSVNAFTLPIITLNNCEVEEGGQAEREGTEGCSEEEIIKVKHFCGNGIEEEHIAGYSQSLGTTEKDSSKRTLMNPLESYSQSLGTTEKNPSRRTLMDTEKSYSQSLCTKEKDSSKRALMNPHESFSQSLGTTEKDSSKRALMNPLESYSQSLGTTEKDSSKRTSMNPHESFSQSLGTTEKDSSRRGSLKDVFRRSSTSLNPQEYESGTVMTLTEPQGALQGQTLTPQGSQLFPPSPVSRAMMGMGSRLSLNSLSSPGEDQPQSARRCSLTVAVCRQGDRARRFSCTRLERSNSKGYIKLETMGGESLEAPDVVTSCVPESNQEE
ncbi:unnamed protein product, partial [Coregonus sp. 'balchen']